MYCVLRFPLFDKVWRGTKAKAKVVQRIEIICSCWLSNSFPLNISTSFPPKKDSGIIWCWCELRTSLLSGQPRAFQFKPRTGQTKTDPKLNPFLCWFLPNFCKKTNKPADRPSGLWIKVKSYFGQKSIWPWFPVTPWGTKSSWPDIWSDPRTSTVSGTFCVYSPQISYWLRSENGCAVLMQQK